MNNLQEFTNDENNYVEISGKINGFSYSHEILGEKFFTTELESVRKSGSVDRIKLMMSEYMLEDTFSSNYVYVKGNFRSYNDNSGDKGHLVLYIFVKDIQLLDEDKEVNQIILDGFLCKNPIYRKTPLGREICDITLAVNRICGKSDYIPCIAWGRNAAIISKMDIGNELKIRGRIQSREYVKNNETKVAYEISIMNIL